MAGQSSSGSDSVAPVSDSDGVMVVVAHAMARKALHAAAVRSTSRAQRWPSTSAPSSGGSDCRPTALLDILFFFV